MNVVLSFFFYFVVCSLTFVDYESGLYTYISFILLLFFKIDYNSMTKCIMKINLIPFKKLIENS